MRKLFFVKKNVNEPTGASNWIEMNVDEFNEFISTEEGKARKNNFAPLLGFGTGDADYYIETTREEVSKIRKENNRHAYLKRLEKESGCVTVSLNELDLYGENTRRWIAEHGSAENITIEEIIFDPLMNKEALNNIFNSICRAFYKSSEYSIRQYKYAYLRDVPKNKRVPHIQTLFFSIVTGIYTTSPH